MGNTYKSSDTVSYGFECDVKKCTANMGKYILEIMKMWRKKRKKKTKSELVGLKCDLV